MLLLKIPTDCELEELKGRIVNGHQPRDPQCKRICRVQGSLLPGKFEFEFVQPVTCQSERPTCTWVPVLRGHANPGSRPRSPKIPVFLSVRVHTCTRGAQYR
eukprot:1191068-Rhodomonas_salina.2